MILASVISSQIHSRYRETVLQRSAKTLKGAYLCYYAMDSQRELGVKSSCDQMKRFIERCNINRNRSMPIILVQ